MTTTQDHIPIKDIVDDIVFLKDGGGALVLQVSAVNFGLLSEREQYGIVTSFAQMLNSLSFSIQIMVHSKRLDISSYLLLLDKAGETQNNPLLSKMIINYRQFIQTLIKENEVLDKKFYVVVPLFKLELGLVSSKISLDQKIKTVLMPRRDQIIRQLSRAGLLATQLKTDKLVELFFDIYNEVSFTNIHTQPAILKTPEKISEPAKETVPSQGEPPKTQESPSAPPIQTNQSKTHPFVVEELNETT